MLLCVLLHAALCCPVCCYAVVCKLVVCLYVVLGFLPELSYSINVTAMVWVHFVDCFPLLLGYISVYVISLRYFHMTRLIHIWFKCTHLENFAYLTISGKGHGLMSV